MSDNVLRRIQQHWTGTKPFDRLISTDVATSVLSIDSFRALDTTRIFAVKTTRHYNREDELINAFPPEFVLNRIMGGREALGIVGILGSERVIRRREFETPASDLLS